MRGILGVLVWIGGLALAAEPAAAAKAGAAPQAMPAAAAVQGAASASATIQHAPEAPAAGRQTSETPASPAADKPAAKTSAAVQQAPETPAVEKKGSEALAVDKQASESPADDKSASGASASSGEQSVEPAKPKTREQAFRTLPAGTAFPHSAEGYVFIEVKGRYKPEMDSDAREMVRFEARFEALEKFLLGEVEEERRRLSPFCRLLAKLVVEPFNFKLPELACSTLPLEDSSEGFRFIIVFEEKELLPVRESLRRRALGEIRRRTRAQWAKCLQDACRRLQSAQERKVFQMLLECPLLSHLQDGRPCYSDIADERAQASFAELSAFLERPLPKGGFAGGAGPLWGLVWGTRGAVSFLDTRREDGGCLEEAKRLFDAGEDLPRILALLRESIEANPASFDKWNYLGCSLEAAGRPDEALVAFVQALRFRPGNRPTLERMIPLCRQAGLVRNAAGLEWWLLMQDDIRKRAE